MAVSASVVASGNGPNGSSGDVAVDWTPTTGGRYLILWQYRSNSNNTHASPTTSFDSGSANIANGPGEVGRSDVMNTYSYRNGVVAWELEAVASPSGATVVDIAPGTSMWYSRWQVLLLAGDVDDYGDTVSEFVEWGSTGSEDISAGDETASLSTAPSSGDMTIVSYSAYDTDSSGGQITPSTGFTELFENASGPFAAGRDFVQYSSTHTSTTVTAPQNTSGDADENFGALALVIPEVVGTPTAPGVPGSVVATAGDGEATVTYVDDAVGSPNATYRVEHDIDGAGYTLASASVAHGVQSFTATGLTNGETIKFRVRAENATGNSAYVESSTVTPEAPPIALVGGSYVRDGNGPSISTDLSSMDAGTIAADDFAILTVMVDQDDLTAITQTAGDTFTLLHYDESTAGRDRGSAMFYRRLDGTETTVTFQGTGDTIEEHSIALSVWRGVDTTTAFDVTWNTSNHYTEGQNNYNGTPDPITTATDDAMVVIAQTLTHDDVTTAGAPDGYLIAIDGTGSTLDNAQQVHVYKPISTAGTETPGAFTHAVNATVAEAQFRTIALRPAPAVTVTDVAGTPTTIAATSGTAPISGTADISGTATTVAVTSGTADISTTTAIAGTPTTVAVTSGTGTIDAAANVAGTPTTVAATSGTAPIDGAVDITGTPTTVAVSSGTADIGAATSVEGTPTAVTATSGTAAIDARADIAGVSTTVAATSGTAPLSAATAVSGAPTTVAATSGTADIGATAPINGTPTTIAATSGVAPISGAADIGGTATTVVVTSGVASISAGVDVTGTPTTVTVTSGTAPISTTTDIDGVATFVSVTSGTAPIGGASSIEGTSTTVGVASGIASISGTADIAGTSTTITVTSGAATVEATANITGTPTTVTVTSGTADIRNPSGAPTFTGRPVGTWTSVDRGTSWAAEQRQTGWQDVDRQTEWSYA